MSKPTHIYIAREQDCGCCTGVVDDSQSPPILVELTADSVADFIKSGRVVERVSYKDFLNKVMNEPGFMNCPHGAKPSPHEQMEMSALI